jgi:hypothetical protein
MEPEGSSSHSQQPSTGPYPEPDQCSPYDPFLSLRSVLIVSIHLHLGLLVVSFLMALPPISCTHYSSLHACYMPFHLILLELIILIMLGGSSLLRSFLHPPVTSSLLSPDFSSGSFSQKPSVCVLSAITDTKYYIHGERQAQL